MKRQRAFLDLNSQGDKKARTNGYSSAGGKLTRNNSMARQIGAVASKNTIEKKNVDFAANVGIISGQTDWSVVQFLQSGLAVGTGPNNRIGRRCNIDSVFIRWICEKDGAGAPECRWLLVYDKNPDGISVALKGDILSDDNMNGMMNLAHSDRFMVIHDEYIDRAASLSSFTQAGSFYKKFKEPLQMVWGGAGGTSADITTGALLLLWVMPSSGTGGNFIFKSRVRYTDA